MDCTCAAQRSSGPTGTQAKVHDVSKLEHRLNQYDVSKLKHRKCKVFFVRPRQWPASEVKTFELKSNQNNFGFAPITIRQRGSQRNPWWINKKKNKTTKH